MREMLLNNADLRLEIEAVKKKITGQDKNIELVFTCLEELLGKKNEPRRQIGFK